MALVGPCSKLSVGYSYSTTHSIKHLCECIFFPHCMLYINITQVHSGRCLCLFYGTMGDNVPSLRYFYFHILTTFVCNRTSQSLLGQIDTLYESVYWGKVHHIFQIHLRPEPVSHGLFFRTGVLQRDHFDTVSVAAILKDFCLSKYTSAHTNRTSFISPFLSLQQPQASSCFITFRVLLEI